MKLMKCLTCIIYFALLHFCTQFFGILFFSVLLFLLLLLLTSLFQSVAIRIASTSNMFWRFSFSFYLFHNIIFFSNSHVFKCFLNWCSCTLNEVDRKMEKFFKRTFFSFIHQQKHFSLFRFFCSLLVRLFASHLLTHTWHDVREPYEWNMMKMAENHQLREHIGHSNYSAWANKTKENTKCSLCFN